MRSSRFLPIVFGAGIVLATACSDATAPGAPSSSQPIPPIEPSLVVLSGSVHASGTKWSAVVLMTDEGQEIPLGGANAGLLLALENAGVEVRGSWDAADGAFQVADFLVKTVNGAGVVDGFLVAIYDGSAGNVELVGYALRPPRGGPEITLIEPSADLLDHLGARIWAAGVSDGAPTAFGVISQK
jgi:hypothetical protein